MYRGDSPVKKVARLNFWNHVRMMVGLEEFRAGPHVVLSGPDAGDVSTLLGLGVKPKGIIAVDIDKHAVDAAYWKFPGMDIRHEDVRETLAALKEPASSVFLDTCHHVSPKSLGLIKDCLRLCEGSVLGIAIYACREQSATRDALNALKALGIRGERLRAHLLTQQLYGRCTSHGWFAQRWIYYCSDSEERYGKPMLIGIGNSQKFPRLLSKRREMLKGANKHLQVLTYQPKEFAQALCNAVDVRGRQGLLQYNVREQEVAAWQAHLTRGTYQRR